jgi:hypothetical protein
MAKVSELAGLSSVIDYYTERGEVVEIEREVLRVFFSKR